MGEVRYYTKQELINLLPTSDELKGQLAYVPLSYEFALRLSPPSCHLAAPSEDFEIQLVKDKAERDIPVVFLKNEDFEDADTTTSAPTRAPNGILIRHQRRKLGREKNKPGRVNVIKEFDAAYRSAGSDDKWERDKGWKAGDQDPIRRSAWALNNPSQVVASARYQRSLQTIGINVTLSTRDIPTTAAYDPQLGGLVDLTAGADAEGAYYECCYEVSRHYLTNPYTRASEIHAALQNAKFSANVTDNDGTTQDILRSCERDIDCVGGRICSAKRKCVCPFECCSNADCADDSKVCLRNQCLFDCEENGEFEVFTDSEALRIALKEYANGDDDRRDAITKIYGEIKFWEVCRISDFSNMFTYLSTFNEPIDGWDMRNARTIEKMFMFAEAFNQDISS